MRKVLFIAAAALIAASGIPGDPAGSRVPVLLELFTSEGCSSCPPADRLLAKFDHDQPVAGADLIVLSEHVDYWNQLGWKDPFSSAFYSDRQREYARALKGEVYTPQLVVDGAQGFVGSDDEEAVKVITRSLRSPKQLLVVDAVRAGNKVKVSVATDGKPEGNLYIALAHDARSSQVLRGENAGHGLSHVAVVYALVQAHKGAAEATMDLQQESAGKTRVVAFISKPDGKVVALGQTRL